MENTRWADEPSRTIQLLTVPEVAARLRISPAKVWQLLARGELRSLKIDNSRRIPEDAIGEFVAGRTAAEEQSRRAGAVA